MNSKGILEVALRVGAIVLAVNVIELFPTHYSTYTLRGSFHWYPFIGFLLLPTLISLFIAVSMWFFPELYLKKLSFYNDSKESDNIFPKEIGTVLLAIIGIYILAISISDMIYHITFTVVMREAAGSFYKIQPDRIAMIITTVAEIVIGLFLIFGRKLITNFIFRFKKELQGDL